MRRFAEGKGSIPDKLTLLTLATYQRSGRSDLASLGKDLEEQFVVEAERARAPEKLDTFNKLTKRLYFDIRYALSSPSLRRAHSLLVLDSIFQRLGETSTSQPDEEDEGLSLLTLKLWLSALLSTALSRCDTKAAKEEAARLSRRQEDMLIQEAGEAAFFFEFHLPEGKFLDIATKIHSLRSRYQGKGNLAESASSDSPMLSGKTHASTSRCLSLVEALSCRPDVKNIATAILHKLDPLRCRLDDVILREEDGDVVMYWKRLHHRCDVVDCDETVSVRINVRKQIAGKWENSVHVFKEDQVAQATTLLSTVFSETDQ